MFTVVIAGSAIVTAIQLALVAPPIIGAIVAHDTGHNGWWGVLIGAGVSYGGLLAFAWVDRRNKRDGRRPPS